MKRIILSILLLVPLVKVTAQVRDTMTYNVKSRLDWSDFKMLPDSKDTIKNANLYVTIQMIYKKVNAWTGVATFEAYGFVLRDSSWVKPGSKNDMLLDYLQFKYDVSNLIAKQLESEINNEKINAGNRKKTGKYFYSYIDKLDRFLIKIDKDTNYGKESAKLENWKQKYKNGLLEE
jgi:hypothetical protein